MDAKYIDFSSQYMTMFLKESDNVYHYATSENHAMNNCLLIVLNY